MSNKWWKVFSSLAAASRCVRWLRKGEATIVHELPRKAYNVLVM